MNVITLLTKARFSLLALMLLLLVNPAQADNKQSLLDHYTKIFTTEPQLAQVEAAKELEWKGLSDTVLFDIVEKNLLANYKTNDKQTADYAAWMAKALAFSGQTKYLATLNEVADHAGNKGTVKHAKNAIDVLAQYTQWNPIISSTANNNAAKSYEINSYANMLRSGNRELQRLACKRIEHENITDAWLLDILNSEAQKAIPAAVVGSEDIDSVNWMLRILMTNPAYRSTVEMAAANAADTKVRKKAADYLKKYPK